MMNTTRKVTGIDTIRHALQLWRVAAMLMVVVLHGAISLMESKGSVALWLVYDGHRHPAFDVLFYWVNGLAMPIFFFLSGLFAAQTFTRRGPEGFLAQRRRRLLRPLVVGLLTIVPLTYAVWGYGLVVSGQYTLKELARRPVLENLAGPGHLWFLEQLLLMSFAYWAVCRGRRQTPANESRLLGSPWRPLLLAVPTALVLWLDVTAIVHVTNSFVPDLVRLAYNGILFAAGTQLASVREPRQSLVRGSGFYLLLSVPAFGVMAALFRHHYAVAPLQGWALLALACSAALFTWLTLFGQLGLLVRFGNQPQPLAVRLADASYWIYFTHLPVVGLLQVLLAPVPWPGLVKLTVVASLAVLIGLISYERLVRGTFVNAVFGEESGRAANALPPERSAHQAA